jgi:hypothetical protein
MLSRRTEKRGEETMNEFGLSLLRLIDEKNLDGVGEVVERMNKCHRRKARRGCPFYSVGDVVAYMRAEGVEDLPRRQEISIVDHMGEALGLDDAEVDERIYDPIRRSISRRHRQSAE